ncbi:MAG: glycoside hydrolase family 38 C-terminal domain-containing protein [Janthinobacterium lividum]
MKTVHLIFNAHIDPIWLWPWQSGLDEALATCRSACDRLDEHPDLTFSRGEAWVYSQVEHLDPDLFARIRHHVESGRWGIIGGWWIQPDCNAPSGWALEKQIALGKSYFENTFGQFPNVAYNVDSFGHAATLPALMREAGQDCYVMMRPQEHEKALPARVFRWRGYEDGPEVTTFRVAGSYGSNPHGNLRDHVNNAFTELPPGIDHTMCFVGLGDHGGGPTETLIAWCYKLEQELREEGSDIHLIFSTPTRFFAAIADQIPTLPLVTGELQMHAIGCYSVYRPVKLGVRRGEHRLRQAEVFAPFPGLEDAWKRVCFHQFHDTLGGTCLPSAYAQVEAELGGAWAAADEALQYGLRRRLNALPDDAAQRMVFANASDASWDGWTEFEPWLDWKTWQPDTVLLDETGTAVPWQTLPSEAMFTVGGGSGATRLLLRLTLAPGEIRVVRICAGDAPAAIPARVTVSENGFIANDAHISCGPDGPAALPGLRLELIEDHTDTWSHGIDRYGSEPVALAEWDAPQILDQGPLMASLVRSGRIGESLLRAEWRVYASEPYAELILDINWRASAKILKLTLPLPGAPSDRVDGILGGSLVRPNSGQEAPLRDWTLFPESGLGVVCPDVFALDATPEYARFTLLRAVPLAYHDPYPGPFDRAILSDQGPHTFRFRFFPDGATADLLESHGLMLQRPLLAADLTRGMSADHRMPDGVRIS